ncbi:MAG TPA: hypothetical protein VEK07_04815, partial [Polyangiaceae bacterium]|nr:hypothetical protein [Polyangiaceae bacterium]
SSGAWGLLPGALALTGTGLAPVGDAQRATELFASCEVSLSVASRRTMGGSVASQAAREIATAREFAEPR